LALKVKTEVPKSSIFGRGISTAKVGACLVFALVSVIILAVAMVIDELQKAARVPVMRHARQNRQGHRKPVEFPMYVEDGRFHLFLSHVWSTGQDQVLAIKKELQLLVPSIRVFLDIENLTDIGGLEKNIEGSDMTLMFLSRGYFGSWNCLREVRHAMMVHLGCDANFDNHTEMTEAVVDRRFAQGAIANSHVILVRETDEAMHGGAPLDELLATCPERIGCGDHVCGYDDGCEACCGCPLNMRAALANHASSDKAGRGVVEWRRAQAFKLVSLKRIVQHLLLSRPDVGKRATSRVDDALSKSNHAKNGFGEVYVSGEIDSVIYAIPRSTSRRHHGTSARVLMQRGNHLSDQLPALLRHAVKGIDIEVLDVTELALLTTANMTRRPILVVCVHRGVFKNPAVVGALHLALSRKLQIVLVHESDAKNRGCEFGEIIGHAPASIKVPKGFNNQKVSG
jgi:hypothetical protein